MKLGKKFLAVGAAGAIVVGGAVAGYAFWTTGGSGTGTAGIGTDTSNVGLVATTTGNLIPGGAAVPVSLATSNPNTYSVAMTGKTVTIAAVKCAGVSVSSAWFSVANGGITSTTITPPAADASTPGTANLSPSGVTIQMNNDAVNSQDGCKANNLTFTLQAA
jgi:hypothetical protein